MPHQLLRDGAVVRGWMNELKDAGSYDIGAERLAEIRKKFRGGYALQSDYAETLAELYDEYGYLADPHTAVAFDVCASYRDGCVSDVPTVVVGTASPVKFAPAVLAALGEEVPDDDVKALRKMEELTAFPVPDSVYALFGMKERFNETIDPSDVPSAVAKFAEKLGERA